MYSGILIGLVILCWMNYQGLTWTVICITGLGLSPLPYLQMHYQKKWFKIFARTGLGLGSTLFIGAPLFFAKLDVFGIIIRVAIIGGYVILAKHALRRRQRTMDRPCDTCTEGVFPLCSWNKEDIVQATKNQDLDPEGREFMKMIVQSLSAPEHQKMVVTLSASDFD